VSSKQILFQKGGSEDNKEQTTTREELQTDNLGHVTNADDLDNINNCNNNAYSNDVNFAKVDGADGGNKTNYVDKQEEGQVN
jgi:hypothetical protein